MENPSVNFKRSETQSLVSLLGTASELHGGNVLLILDNDVQLSTHICFLSSSPILKRLFLDLEVRIDKTSCISMPGFDEATVRQLLQFLHRGFVGKIDCIPKGRPVLFINYKFLIQCFCSL